jgi:hypothetical protein
MKPAIARDGRTALSSDAAPSTDEVGSSLAEPTLTFWESELISEDARIDYLSNQLDPPYKAILADFFGSANMCVDRFYRLQRRHEQWRWGIIVGTGLVAIVNALAALVAAEKTQSFILGLTVTVLASGGAAVLAAMLAILANLENFGNFLERGQSYREARELYVDAGREFERLWQTHVVAFWPRAEACVNARELYRRICVRDSELRRKVKELTQVKSPNASN